VKSDIPADPVAVAALGANGIMFEAEDLSNLVHQFEFRIRDDRFDRAAAG